MPWRQIKHSKGMEHNRGSEKKKHKKQKLDWNQRVSFEDIRWKENSRKKEK